jgi:CotH kinase protein/Chitobiase/beta-hexosaminidase C-terminal domain/Lamin Tail Domain
MKTFSFFSLIRGLAVLFLLYGAPQCGVANQILIPRGSTWRYNNQGHDLTGEPWRELIYDDSGWGGPSAGPLGDNVEGTTQEITAFGGTVIDIGPMGTRFPTIYFRKTFNVSSAANYEGLILRIMRDDEVFIYLNGQFLTTSGCGGGITSDQPSLAYSNYCCVGAAAVGGVEEYVYWEIQVPATLLVNGPNVFAVEGRNQAATSSDFAFDLEVEGVIDNLAPVLIAETPPAAAVVTNLQFITVTFDSAVAGVNAADLLINNQPATNVVVLNPREYTFYFPTPATGTVQVAFAPGHGITDTSLSSNAFAGANWTYTFDPNLASARNFVISEFMALNSNGSMDDDGDRSDWIEIQNRGPIAANLEGCYLTDTETNLTKWRFPNILVPANGFLLVWASGKDRLNPSAPLHTNFRLAGSGEYLALLDPNTNVISEFAPAFPPQQPNISYGRDSLDPTFTGYFQTPTPGGANSTRGSSIVDAPVFLLASGMYTNESLTVEISGPTNAVIRYTLNGNVPTNGSPAYTGPITLTGNTLIKARAFSPNIGEFPSPVAAGSYLLLDSSVREFNSNLPLILLNTPVAIPQYVNPSLPRAPASCYVIEPQAGRTSIRGLPQVVELAGLEIFGQTAAGFPKKPYRVELQDVNGNDKKVSILGMPAEADWRLINPYTDKCLMNNFLAYELFEQMGHYQMRRHFVEVFVHSGSGRVTSNDYSGIMLITEILEQGPNRVNIDKLAPTDTTEPRISGGYIFKKDKDSPGDLNFQTTGAGGFGGQALKIHEPKPREITTNQLRWLTNYLGLMEKALYATTWQTATGTNHYSYYLDVDSFVDQFMIVEFTKQIDGYRLSTFWQKDRNGKIKPEPIFDWDRGLGNANFLDGGNFSGWYYTQLGFADHPWASRLIRGNIGANGIGDPDFCQKIADRWSVLRTNVFSGARILGRVDAIAAELNEAATRDFVKFPRLGTYVWPNPQTPPFDMDYVTPTTYAGIIAQFKKWLNGRYMWMDAQFIVPPVFSGPGGLVDPGTSISLSGAPAGGSIYYTLDGSDPRASGGGVAPGAILYAGPITINANVEIIARAKGTNGWQQTWSGPARGGYFTALPSLRISEIMYHPATTAGEDEHAFEFVEVQNIGATSLNLSGFVLSGGVQFTFPNQTLAPGESAVIVSDPAGFQSRYGTSIRILGTFTGHLGNDSDQLALIGPRHEPILDFSYSDSWYPATDGHGFSLVINDANAGTPTWNSAAGWRPSAAMGGSPGAVDPPPPLRPTIYINEFLANKIHSSIASSNVVELYNPGNDDVTLTGWFLSDDFGVPKKYIIPPDPVSAPQPITIHAHSFRVLGFTVPFDPRPEGGQMFLFSGNGVDLTGYAHGFRFGPSYSGVTQGRYVNSQGTEFFVHQQSNTLGFVNGLPLPGPAVISEVHYHPQNLLLGTNGIINIGEKYIELRGNSDHDVPLYDPNRPTNTWRLRGSVQFDFPTNVSVPENQSVLVVGFDANNDADALARFRARLAIPSTTIIVGPWSGDLPDGPFELELLQPRADASEPPVYVSVEKIQFFGSAGWPQIANGLGLSLQRVDLEGFGNDPTNWVAAGVTPGSSVEGGPPPVIVSQPGDRLVTIGSDQQLTVEATGPNLRYQWLFMGELLEGATNSTLTFNNIQGNQSGIYNILVINGGGGVVGTNFTVVARVKLAVVQQPPSQIAVLQGLNTNLTVGAVGAGVLHYQWYHNGTAIDNATSSSLSLTNVKTSDAGNYFAHLTDDYDTLDSSTVDLQIGIKPVPSVQPVSIEVVEGQTAAFTVGATGTTPIAFRWRTATNGGALSFVSSSASVVSGVSNSTLLFTNVPYSTNVIRVVAIVSNLFGTGPVSSPALLTVLKDSDHDGLPDVWEAAHGFDTNNVADGLRDDDGDGMSNAQEYIAGTDYLDASSYLKAEALRSGLNRLQFLAVSNRTYTVQYSDSLLSAPWQKLVDVPAGKTNRTQVIVDESASSNRFYRLVIPIQP